MVSSVVKTGISFDEFIAQYGDDTRYELIDGELIEMEPTGPLFETLREHEQVAALVK